MNATDSGHDWVSALVLQEALKAWRHSRSFFSLLLNWGRPDAVYVSEYRDFEQLPDGNYRILRNKPPVRVWRLNDANVTTVAMEQRTHGNTRGRIYQYIEYRFVVLPENNCLLLNWTIGPHRGGGAVYRVEGEGSTAALKYQSGGWVN